MARTIFSRALAPLLLASCAAASQAQVQFPVGPPAPKAGETVKFRVTDMWNDKEVRTSSSEVVEVQPDRIVVRGSTSTRPEVRTFHFNGSWQPCRSLQDGSGTVCTGALKFPLQLGDKYGYEKLPWPNGAGLTTATCETRAEEKVTVPAGTFDTVRIECAGFWTRVYGGTFTGRMREVLWYAPKLGRPVKTEFEDFHSSGRPETRERSELLEFAPGK